MTPWERESEGEVHDHRIFRVRRFEARSPRTGRSHPFTVLECDDWVNVIALDERGHVILVRQFRHGTRETTLEIPGGVIEPRESPEAAAARELREETGYAGGNPVRLGTVEPNPAIQTNRCHTVLIEGCRRVAEPDPDPGEDLEVVTMPVEEAFAAARDGRIRHALVICAFAWWRERGFAP